MHLAEEKKDDQIGAVKEVSSFGISLIPGLGDAKDLQEVIDGMDLITGKKLSALERVLAGACVIVSVVSGSMVRMAGKNANIAEKWIGKDVRLCRSRSGSKTVDDLINGLEETTNGKEIARNFETFGGYEQTLKDFEALNPSNVKDIQTKYGFGKVGTLSDGTKVVARQGSTTGGATLEIKISNSKVCKIRY